ncbi:MAG: SprB repeat-containing protein [Salibacteraceae bacterium]
MTCNGANDGNITVTISAGAAPFTYLWSSLQTTPSISGLPAGTYTVFVSDSTGCSDTLTATITEPAPIV